jgi:hypothetical protein
MPVAQVRPEILYAWKGPSLLVVNPRGDCGEDRWLSGFYHREARFIRTLRLHVNGVSPWLCECTSVALDELAFTYVPPVYAPEIVADAILHAAQHPVREIIAGGAGVTLSAARFAPRLADRYMERWTFDAQRTRVPVSGRPDNLYAPVDHDGGARGRFWHGHTRRTSAYTLAVLHPKAAALASAAAFGFAAAVYLKRIRTEPSTLTGSPGYI